MMACVGCGGILEATLLTMLGISVPTWVFILITPLFLLLLYWRFRKHKHSDKCKDNCNGQHEEEPADI